MPTYEYECDKCKHKFDVFQSMSAKHLKKCPECGGKITRLFGTGAGVIFKGSGFYQTDYKNKKSSDSVKPCDKLKSNGCKGCSMNKDK